MLWTSEAVSNGHPDKVADQIADAILDEYLRVDPSARVAVEVLVTRTPDGRDTVILTGEVSVGTTIPAMSLVKGMLEKIGYTSSDTGFDASNVQIFNYIRTQSSEIANAVVKEDGLGAGDQGIMFGFACNETNAYMPLAHFLAHDILDLIQEDRESGDSIFYPDTKSQVTLEYENDVPVRVNNVLISACHKASTSYAQLAEYVNDKIIPNIGYGTVGTLRHRYLFDDHTTYHINPSGEWNVGGPASDTGLSGRKIVVDNYGADCPIGGGSFSGKDPTKVDRSAAYAARHIAVNLVGAGLCEKARVQLGYGIGMIEPVSINVEAWNLSSGVDLDELNRMVRETVPLSPRAIIDRLDLQKPIYQKTASGGHFGRNYSWDQLSLVDTFDNWYAHEGRGSLFGKS